MKFDINTIISQISALGQGLRTNHFLVTLNPPSTISKGLTSQQLTLTCEAAPLPGIQLATIDRSLPYGYGPNYKLPIGAAFSDINLNFLSDSKGLVHKLFTDWMGMIIPFNTASVTNNTSNTTPYFISYMSDYSVNVNISALDLAGNPVINYTLYNTYPSFMGDIQGNWSEQDQLVRIPVRFNFSNWSVSYNNTATNISSLNTSTSPSNTLTNIGVPIPYTSNTFATSLLSSTDITI